jgi:hypothetical protein
MNSNLRFLKLNKNFRNFYSLNKKTFVVAQNILDYTCKTNPRVFFTVTKNGTNLGKLTFEVKKTFILVIRQSLPKNRRKFQTTLLRSKQIRFNF